jgi:hypothetical protein
VEPLNKDEMALKESYIEHGFPDWSRRDFQQFVQALEAYGWYITNLKRSSIMWTLSIGLWNVCVRNSGQDAEGNWEVLQDVREEVVNIAGSIPLTSPAEYPRIALKVKQNEQSETISNTCLLGKSTPSDTRCKKDRYSFVVV